MKFPVGSEVCANAQVKYETGELNFTLRENQAKLQRAWEAMERMRASAVANGVADMPMEEIDEEIRKYREERKAKRMQEGKK